MPEMRDPACAVADDESPPQAALIEALQQEVSDLRTAMRTRSPIDQALGVIMAENRCDADVAWGVLLSASQQRNVRVSALAETIVRQVAGRVIEPRPVRPRGS